MDLSKDGEVALHGREAFRSVAYKDIAGIWTIGYGSTRVKGIPVKEGDKITEADAVNETRAFVSEVVATINKLVKVPLTQNQFDALVSFIYNVGITAFTNSTLLKLLNLREYLQAADQFLRWTFAGGKYSAGLYNRRVQERKQFLT